MPNPNPEVDVATALVLGGSIALLDPPSGLVTAALGGLVLLGPERESDAYVANLVINVLNTGGPPPEPVMNAGGSIYRARVQVLVRSQVDAYEAGRDLARAALRKLHLVILAGYTDVMAQETEPNYLGIDQRQVHRWSFNLLARWNE